MSQDNPSHEEESDSSNPSPMSSFLALCEQYYDIVNETSPEFQREKLAIEQAFSRDLEVLDNYEKEKIRLIIKEGKFMQQLEDEKIEYEGTS
ncbi:hypothetical protein M9Y10_011317 [Tritrichomonas musculus]|uniref:Uncharacterized protein n=1 Tax=Tritrichomonas musculus TaxID=1915356 RepID=A0ABR2IJ75_9EUKA